MGFRSFIRALRSIIATGPKSTTPTHQQIFDNGRTGIEPTADYHQALLVLDNVVRDCISVSRQHGGIPSQSTKHFYASVLFTTLLSRGISLVMLAPHSPWAQKLIEHWDYASAAVIVRTMMEIRAAFYYLCTEATSVEEWDCRWNLLCLHDCCARIRFLEARESNPQEFVALQNAAEDFRNRLRANPFFATVGHQKRLLNGGTAYLYPLEEILESAGLQKSTYRSLNVLFSSHVHGLPMSYFRMAEEDRGRGLPSPVEESHTTVCLSLASSLLTATRDEVLTIFQTAEGSETTS